jgi:phosphoglycolate phosphatase
MISHIFFDFDGVLHNTFDLHLRELRNFSGKNLTEQEYRDLHNGNFYENREDKLKGMDWIQYREHILPYVEGLVVEKRIRKTLERLKEERVFSIVSSGGERLIEGYLYRNNLRQYFSDILGGNFHTSKVEKFKYLFEKHKVNQEKAVFVTDTLGDIEEANVVELRTIAVTFGFHNREMLKRGNPLAIVDTPEEVVTRIQSL